MSHESSAISALPPVAQTGPGLLLPIGGGYSDIYAGFSAAAVANARDGQATILVLPTAYASNPLTITEAERATNLRDAEERRFQLEEACKRAAPDGITCRAVLAPIFTRADAADPAKLAPFRAPLAGIFMLGGDQTIAMAALVDTPAERALTDAHAAGTVIAGTSAGGGMLSATMLGGYHLNYAAANSLDFGAADVWRTADRRGLPFGLQDAILDQHFFQRGRFGRLLNAIALPDAPHVGVGVDAYTGVVVEEGTRLRDVFGLYAVAVLDAATYHAAEGVRYVPVAGQPDRPPLLSLRNVLVHLLAAGDFSYDLAARRHSLAPPAAKVARGFDALRVPDGAGVLFLAGDLSQRLQAGAGGQLAVLERFVQRAGGAGTRLLIYADGYASARSARTAAEDYAAALGAPAEIVVASEAEGAPALQGVTGVLLIGRDQSKVDPTRLAWLREPWLAGMPVLADNALAPLLGAFYSAHGPTPKDAEQAEIATQKAFRQGITEIAAGLGLLEITVEPQLLNDNRWGRFFSLAYNQPDRLAVGLTRATALAIGPQGAEVIGDNVVFLLDLRQAAQAAGESGGFVIANGLLDVYAPGEQVAPTVADVSAVPARQPTPALPALPTLIPTAAPSPAPQLTPTRAAVASTASATDRPVMPTVAPVASQPSGTGAASSLRVPAVASGIATLVIAGAAYLFWRLRRSQ